MKFICFLRPAKPELKRRGEDNEASSPCIRGNRGGNSLKREIPKKKRTMGSLGIVIGAGSAANEDNDIKVFGWGRGNARATEGTKRPEETRRKAFACLYLKKKTERLI